MGFWAKAQPDFGRADDGDALSAPCTSFEVSLKNTMLQSTSTVHLIKANGGGVHGDTLGRHPFLKASLENHL
jgi:hypothetical protein